MAYEGSQRLGELFKSRREKGEPGLPTLSVTLNNGLVDRLTLGRKTDTSLADDEHLLVRKGDIVYNMMRMWQGASGLAKKDGLVSPAYVVLAPKAKIDPRYASYLFKSQRMIYLFWAYSYGLTEDRLRLYYKDFARIPVAVPDVHDQKTFAELLSIWDRAINASQALIENDKFSGQALLRRLLTDRSENWYKTNVGRLATFKSGGTPSKQNVSFWGGSNPWISAKDLKSHHICTSLATLTNSGFSVASIAPEGSSLILVRGMTLLNDLPVGYATRDVAFNQDVKALIPRACVDPLFLSYLLAAKKDQIRDLVSTAGHGTGKLETEQLKNFEVSVPPLAEQIEIAAVLSAWSKVSVANVRHLELLRLEKRALMQQLLTGQRRTKLDSAA